MGKTLDFLVTHFTSTIEGREVTCDEIRQWHLSPSDLPNGRVKYRGRIYNSREDLPEELLNGRYIENLTGRGWDRLGYSDMVHIDGSVENLTPYNLDGKVDPEEVTWGAAGINLRSRHIVYVGGLREELIDGHYEPADTRTDAQKYALEIYYKYMILRHPKIQIAGHNQFSKKVCPGFNVPEFCVSIGISDKNIYYAPK